jgi:E3 ubiquitin-protein ligase HUWE1
MFSAVVKLFLYTRRNPDPSQKKQATAVAMLVSKVLLEHLRWRGSGQYFYSFSFPRANIRQSRG